MIFSVSDYTCAILPYDQILYIKQIKDELPRNPSTVFRVRVRALFEWQKPLKSRVRVRVTFERVRAVYKRTFKVCLTTHLRV